MLFQPTSITPDQLGGLGNGIVSPDSPLTVSWLVNGNSAMVAFQIDYYYNNAASTLIRSTGKLTDGCPFYGTDALGNRQFFTYTDSTVNLSTTNEWKMVITQWWSANDYVVQTSPSTFVVKDSPTLSVNVPGTVAQRDYTFTATYSQAQDDALNWVRWKVAINSVNGRANPLYDSGNIYGTALLECYYDGFFTGTSYCVKCMAETQSGIDLETEWMSFLVSYPTETLTGQCVAKQADCQKTAVYVEWNGFRYIYGEAEGDYTIDNGLLSLPFNSFVTWDEVNGSPMSIGTPWYIIGKCTLQRADAELIVISFGSHKITMRYKLTDRELEIVYDTTVAQTVSYVAFDETLTYVITPTGVSLRRDTKTGGLYPANDRYPANTLYPSGETGTGSVTNTYAVSYTQAAIKSIKVGGAQICDYIQELSDMQASDITTVLAGNYTPQPTAGTNFLADFVEGLSAGSLYIAGTEINGWAVYRQQNDNPILMHIANTAMNVNALYDYSACSQQGAYTYYVYPMGTDKYITSPLISNAVSPLFWNWSVLECTYNEEIGYFECVNEFLFGKNLETGAISNNNKPNILENFTQYPLVQLSPQRYKSGSLKSLIGVICRGEYTDTIDQREAIDKLSNTTNSLFLKNRKGDIWEIRISDSISFETMDNSRMQAQTVSLSWVQIADATETSIIQTTLPTTISA